jgi:hypothetical protein
MLNAPDGSQVAALPALPLAARRLPSKSDTPRPSPPPEGVVSGAAGAPNPGHSFFGSGIVRALGSVSGEEAPETAPHALRAALGAAVSPAALLDDVEVELADAVLSAGPPSTSVALSGAVPGGAVRGGATPGAKAEPITAVRALALFAGSRGAPWPAPTLPLPPLPLPLLPLPLLPLLPLLLPLLGVASEFCPAPLTKLP